MEWSLSIRLVLDGQPIASETTAFAAGPRVIVLRSASNEAELVLYSSYTGDDSLTRALVSELIEFGLNPVRLEAREISVGEGAFTYSRRFAIYDHLQRLQGLCSELLGAELRYEEVGLAVCEFDRAVV